MAKRNGDSMLARGPAAATKRKSTANSKTKARSAPARAKPLSRAAAVRSAKAAPVRGPSPASPAKVGAVRLPRDPKGRRAQFYQDPAIDQLWAVVAALAAEVSVAFDRLDTFERVLERHGYVTRAAIEAYRPDDAAAADRARKREELIQRVFQVLSQYSR